MSSRPHPAHPNHAFVQLEKLEPRMLLAAVKIMPIGNSITSSFTTDPGYRFWLSKQLDLAGYEVDFVGSLTGNHSSGDPSNQGTPPYADFDQDHEGHAGFRADQLLAELPNYLQQNVPDVVLMHVGTNDMLQSISVEVTIERLGLMIDGFRAANPNVTILLAQLIPTGVLVENIQALNAAIPSLASAKDTPQSRVIVVDQFTGFSPQTDLKDQYHPNISGENKLADNWFNTLTQVLPAPDPPPTPVKFLTDLEAVSATNGQGPVEINFSSGGAARADGGAINLNGVSTIKGLGTHANSEIVYSLQGQYARFLADVGVDDEVGSGGSVVFQVFVDGQLRFDSGVMTGDSVTKSVDVNVAGAQTLRLVVTDAGDGNELDHADWANARLTLAEPEPTPVPQVTSSEFVFRTAPHELRFTFSSDVSASLDRGDMVLTRINKPRTIPTRAIAVRYDPTTNTAIFTFPGFKSGIIPDGRYRATLPATGITDTAGQAMDSDHVFEFFFLTGDANHDGSVDRSDFEILLANYGQRNRDFTHGDFNYDSKVDERDFKLLVHGYLSSLVSGNVARPKGKLLSRLVDELRADLDGDSHKPKGKHKSSDDRAARDNDDGEKKKDKKKKAKKHNDKQSKNAAKAAKKQAKNNSDR